MPVSEKDSNNKYLDEPEPLQGLEVRLKPGFKILAHATTFNCPEFSSSIQSLIPTLNKFALEQRNTVMIFQCPDEPSIYQLIYKQLADGRIGDDIRIPLFPWMYDVVHYRKVVPFDKLLENLASLRGMTLSEFQTSPSQSQIVERIRTLETRLPHNRIIPVIKDGSSLSKTQNVVQWQWLIGDDIPDIPYFIADEMFEPDKLSKHALIDKSKCDDDENLTKYKKLEMFGIMTQRLATRIGQLENYKSTLLDNKPKDIENPFVEGMLTNIGITIRNLEQQIVILSKTYSANTTDRSCPFVTLVETLTRWCELHDITINSYGSFVIKYIDQTKSKPH